MAFKIINDFKWYITNIINSNIKDKNKEGGCVLIKLHLLIKVLKVYLAMKKLIPSLDSLLFFSFWSPVSFESHIDTLIAFKTHLCYFSFPSILNILLTFSHFFSFFFYDFLSNFFSDPPSMVCSRITFL
jgi:hypothetical protein